MSAAAVATNFPTNLSWGTAAAQAAGLGSDLLSKISTVFVPSDEAIKTYVSATGAVGTELLATDAGKMAVTAHVIPNKALSSADLPSGESTFETVAGTPLMVNNSGGSLTVSAGGITANVVQSDISTGNAVLFIVDKVLAPLGVQ